MMRLIYRFISIIIPIGNHYTVAHNLIGWRKFYTSINSMGRNLGTIFLSPAPNLCNNVDKNKILDEKVRIISNKLLFLLILSICNSQT